MGTSSRCSELVALALSRPAEIIQRQTATEEWMAHNHEETDGTTLDTIPRFGDARLRLDGTGRLLMIAAVLVYLLGVQLPTVTINIPLNNKLQALQIDGMDQLAQEAARQDFESRWNTWSAVRTVLASLVSVPLILLLSRL